MLLIQRPLIALDLVQHLVQRSLGPFYVSGTKAVQVITRKNKLSQKIIPKWTKHVFDMQKGVFFLTLFQHSQLCLFDLQPTAWIKAACTLNLSSRESTASQNLPTLPSPALPSQSIYRSKWQGKKKKKRAPNHRYTAWKHHCEVPQNV